MQSRWLAKSASAVALVAVMATETLNPPSAHAGVPGVFATEYTQLLNYVELVGQLEKQVTDGRKPAHSDRRHGKARHHDHRSALRDGGLGHHQPSPDREHRPSALLHDEQPGQLFPAPLSRLLIVHQLRPVLSDLEPNQPRQHPRRAECCRAAELAIRQRRSPAARRCKGKVNRRSAGCRRSKSETRLRRIRPSN